MKGSNPKTNGSANLVFITGGARSGKSSFALELANKLDGEKIYIATSEPLDSEMTERIRQHREERGPQWKTVEEPLDIVGTILNQSRENAVILVDCLTLWVSNLISMAERAGNTPAPDGTGFHVEPCTVWCRVEHCTGRYSVEQSAVWKTVEDAADRLISTFCAVQSSSPCSALFIVSNEVGMGIVPDNPLARKFRDITGKLNQRVASAADEVYTVISGIPLKLKG